jgi:hypothetical protein
MSASVIEKRMPEAEIREEREAFHTNVEAVMKIRSMRRDKDPEKDCSLTSHFSVGCVRP